MAKSNQMLKSRPLMYIQQPEFEFITAGTQVMEVKAVPKQEEKISPTVDEPANELLEKVNQKEEKPVLSNRTNSENAIKSGVRKKTFATKTIEEKLLFLTKLPNNMPPVTCEIRTKGESCRGIVTSYVNGLVAIRTITDQEEVQLHKEEITAISIVSL